MLRARSASGPANPARSQSGPQLERKPLKLASGSFKIGAGVTAKVKVKLSGDRVTLLRQDTSARKAVAIADVRDGAGNKGTARKQTDGRSQVLSDDQLSRRNSTRRPLTLAIRLSPVRMSPAAGFASAAVAMIRASGILSRAARRSAASAATVDIDRQDRRDQVCEESIDSLLLMATNASSGQDLGIGDSGDQEGLLVGELPYS